MKRCFAIVLLACVGSGAGCQGPDVIRTPPDDRRPNRHRPVRVPSADEMPGPADGAAPAAPADAASDRLSGEAGAEPGTAPLAAPVTIFEHAPFPIRPAAIRSEPGTYPATPAEAPFLARTFGPESSSLDEPVGAFVSWFGIVRGIEAPAGAAGGGVTRIWVESKGFDGGTDPSVLGVDFNGGGDFIASLVAIRHPPLPLALVRVYGTVTSRAGGLPRVAAEYVREWDWAEFRFVSAKREQRGSERWRANCKVTIDDASMADPVASPAYFIERLGARSSFLEQRPEFPRANDP